uniref:App1 n=1 Tax=Coccidioides posadasii RMSCC 3488 TaxID=454284 RepID=A0A0J6EUK9_COCPO|nr:app1 [Coccidioides posadasii RMSCC 3488]
MATLNLSTNGHSISKSYQSVVNAPAPSGPAAESGTYGQWAVFTVSAPLVSAFQDTSTKESVLKVQSTGEGELIDLIEEFSEGRIQFAYVKVKDPNTGLPKNVLIAWCGEGVPERTKGYFTSHLAAVSKLLHGYHVQITARSDRDLTPESIVQKVSDSSGAKYSAATTPPPVAAGPKPPVASKPAFTPTRVGGSFRPLAGTHRAAGAKNEPVDEDGWGADAPQVTRTQLEKVQPAYQPTKVNIKELMSQKSSTTSSYGQESSNKSSPSNVVKGGYQPIGKVDIAEIRRQAREAGEIRDDRPEPVKGSYQPVGKVDIAAIRAKARGGEPLSSSSGAMSPARTGDSVGNDEPKTLADRSAAFTPSERLTTLPKPKVAKKFGGGSTFTGTKAPLPGGLDTPAAPAAPVVGSASRTFADVGGKTPSQLWAEKKAKQGGVSPTPAGITSPPPIQNQTSGESGWKSSYTGKTWAPVQTTHTGRSSGAAVSEQRTGGSEPTAEAPETGTVGSIRDKFANTQPMGAPASTYERAAPSPPPLATETKPVPPRAVPLPGLPTDTRENLEDIHQDVPPPPQQPRSPSPETAADVEPSSPIRVAMPVARGSADEHVADAHEEQYSPPAPLPTRSIVEHAPSEEQLETQPSHDPARAVAEATAPSHAMTDQGIRALVQYDYERAEDNEIELREGEYVTNIDMVDEDWWLGVNARGEHGLFPRSYVEVVQEGDPLYQPASSSTQIPPAQPAPAQHTAAQPAESHGRTATALYDYEAAEDNEIAFPEGARITNIEFPDEDWWVGDFGGQRGLFPANYVQLDQ